MYEKQMHFYMWFCIINIEYYIIGGLQFENICKIASTKEKE